VWVGWGWLTYDDPLGTNTHRFEGQFFDPPLGVAEVLERLPEAYLSYWGKFASAVYLHPATYVVLTGLVVLAGLGSGFRVFAVADAPLRVPTGAWWVLWTALIVTSVGLVYWIATINFITGRLVFPAHAAICVLMVAGVRGWVGGRATARGRAVARPYRISIYGVVIGVPAMIGWVVISPTATHAAYRQPPPVPNNLALTETVYTFDDSIQLDRLDGRCGANPPGRPVHDHTLLGGAGGAGATRRLHPADRAGWGFGRERVTVHGLGRYDWRLWEGAIATAMRWMCRLARSKWERAMIYCCSCWTPKPGPSIGRRLRQMEPLCHSRSWDRLMDQGDLRRIVRFFPKPLANFE
jgi:hypothetical protein